ncbi:hypothetical protein PC116_g9629 [Phytophthora cactorum]|uniref:Uncharacterized protein n=1 Tax=Phytophthora cactorum TaxID=29920 RepID=A0A8T1E645_9STRA|nr:hypothetical protein PC117_g6611 [Phytophthora cactorum]KAG4242481.1 hypothetical protein PC116_g9629 [Phytophthora cactorum]
MDRTASSQLDPRQSTNLSSHWRSALAHMADYFGHWIVLLIDEEASASGDGTE